MTFPQNFPLSRTSELSVYGRCAAVCTVQCLPTKPCFGSPGSRRKLNTLYLVQSCVFSGTFTCGTSHGSNVLICQPGMTDGKRMMPRPKKLVTVRRENNILIFYSFVSYYWKKNSGKCSKNFSYTWRSSRNEKKSFSCFSVFRDSNTCLWKTLYNAVVTCHQSHVLFSYP